jgi:uncharacterized protein (TIGR02145 family)
MKKFLIFCAVICLIFLTITEAYDSVNADNNTGTVTDIDGNVYHTVKIGNQVWTVVNLRTTKYNDGSPIPLVTEKDAWIALSTPGYCYYNNTTDADRIKKNGALYNWYAVDTKKLAPVGWHVPTDAEWNTLQNYLIINGYNWDGTTTDNKIAKSMAAKTDWKTDTDPGTIGNDLSENNKSGFSALPAGFRSFRSGNFVGNFGRWWSATENGLLTAYCCSLNDDLVYFFIDHYYKSCGYSVRIIKDN